MPHGQTWFSLLPFHERLSRLAAFYLGGEQGRTWLAGQPVELQHVYLGLFVLLLIAIVAVVTETSIRDAGKDVLPHERLTIRNFVELLVGSAYNSMVSIMGAQAARFFLPLIGTCAFFILFSNAIGLVPGFAPPTDNLNTTLACAGVIFVATHYYGLKHHGFHHIKHFFGPVWWLAPLMFVIELISHLARPFSLAIRLMANMTADHLVLGIFCALLPVALFWVPVALPMYVLGSIVVVVQTLVFCMLSTVYIAMAIEDAKH